MFKQSDVIFFYAESSVHIGGGRSVGVIDKAIQRERHTDYPVGPSSGVKGAIRDWFGNYHQHNDQDGQEKIKITFGPDSEEADANSYAGAAAFTDAKILLFPVRSLKGVFAWVTSPYAIQRLARDLQKMGNGSASEIQNIPQPAKGSVAASNSTEVALKNQVVLEEYTFGINHEDSAKMNNLTTWLKKNAIPDSDEYEFWKERLMDYLLVLHDDDFRDFLKHSTEVQARVKLGKGKSSDTKKGGNLFYEEFLPAETILYSQVFTQDALAPETPGEFSEAGAIMRYLKNLNGKRVQFGANESIGKGIMHAHFLNGKTEKGENHE